MKIVFASNYYNHHQKPFSEAMYSLTDGGYRFIQSVPMDEERKNMGWGEKLPPFVMESYKDEKSYKECLKAIDEADVVITGSAPEEMIHSRIKHGKLTFRYSERIFKAKGSKIKLPVTAAKQIIKNFPYKNLYLLCASAYSARDYALAGVFHNKAYKWGYFPEVKKYDDVASFINKKRKASILWVARLIGLKHPYASILVAERLMKDGYDFHLDIIGVGPLEEELKAAIKEKGLESHVSMLGAMKPEEVRKHMEESSIFLFTSDFNEGWGAVLNESMNSGCAVVASHAIGSVPFLMKDGVNGLIYKNGDIDDLYNKTKWLLDNPDKAIELGENAYKTLNETWNAEVAAKRLIKISETLLRGEKIDGLYLEGPCSKAEKLKDNWYE